MFFLSQIWLIPLLPALGAATMFFFGRKLQKSTVNAVCVGVVVVAFLLACGAVWQYSDYSRHNLGKPYENILYTWLGSDTCHLTYLMHDGTPDPFPAAEGVRPDHPRRIW